ncbi:MAG: signal peptide peptidase SppA [Desulfatiglandales bacterium]
MKGTQHPMLVVFVVLVTAVLVLAAVMTAIFALAGRTGGFSLKDRIGVIPIEGAITNSETVVSQLVEFTKDRRVKAIILRVNSPGGGVAPSQEIYREILKTREKKKIVASMGTVAASGGYYVASGAHKIVASPGTLTGSIGVLMEFVRFQELMEKIGVDVEVLKSGEFKDIGSPHRKLTEQEKEMIQALVFDIQNQFVEAVAQGRNLPMEEVREIADGRIISGSQGLELGLVDQLGNFRDAVDLAKSMAGIKGEANLVYPKRTKVRLWDILAEDASRAVYRALRNAMGMQIEYRWDGLPY